MMKGFLVTKVRNGLTGPQTPVGQWRRLNLWVRFCIAWALVVALAVVPSLWLGGTANPCLAYANAQGMPPALSNAVAQQLWQQQGPGRCYVEVVRSLLE